MHSTSWDYTWHQRSKPVAPRRRRRKKWCAAAAEFLGSARRRRRRRHFTGAPRPIRLYCIFNRKKIAKLGNFHCDLVSKRNS